MQHLAVTLVAVNLAAKAAGAANLATHAVAKEVACSVTFLARAAAIPVVIRAVSPLVVAIADAAVKRVVAIHAAVTLAVATKVAAESLAGCSVATVAASQIAAIRAAVNRLAVAKVAAARRIAAAPHAVILAVAALVAVVVAVC